MDTVKTIEGYLPIFPGFYETIYENGDTEYCAIGQAIDDLHDDCGVDVEYDDFEFDYESRREDIVKRVCEVTENYFHDLEFVTYVKPLALTHPKEYNYSNNQLDVEIGLDETWSESMKTYIDEYRDKLIEIIKDNHTSYDGFISFMSNRIETWETIIFHHDKIDELMDKYGKYSDEYIDALRETFPDVSPWDISDNYNGNSDIYVIHMLSYIMSIYYTSNGGFCKNLTYAIAEDVLEDIYDGEYVSLTEEADKKLEGVEHYYARPKD